ncbi:MAG: replication-associated recombination protein A [Candidatus Electryonea clarkiae]|nr:replication-associated recombination protein A [Candidatus Electryonea clarkiae]MDP8285910.1 replication-associated recombination protein A [Candidatus Electryonea clarkiae]
MNQNEENLFDNEDHIRTDEQNSSEASGTGFKPLADRMRPKNLDSFVGQDHLVGPDGALRPLLDAGRLHSMIFWGSPGVGKTTLARLLADRIEADFHQLSAVASGVSDVRRVIEQGLYAKRSNRRTVLFIDEIHRFNKAQQDALLHAVEEGTIVLIGATTENPSFEVIAPLLSRCRVYRFEQLTEGDLEKVLDGVFESDDEVLSSGVKLDKRARRALLELSLGDARELLNLLERSMERAQSLSIKKIDLKILETVASQALSRYDKQGDRHYDTISAFIKCVRNSDPDAAVYWLARMLDGGEDPLFIARRLIILASEDIGNANPNALLLAQAGFEAVHKIGMPEARIILSQVTTYLASSLKSNASYVAINEALAIVREGKQPAVPLHLRNAVTGLMKTEGYAEGYRYAHSEVGAVSPMPGLPPELEGTRFYRPKQYGAESGITERLEAFRKMKEEIASQEKEDDNSIEDSNKKDKPGGGGEK